MSIQIILVGMISKPQSHIKHMDKLDYVKGIDGDTFTFYHIINHYVKIYLEKQIGKFVDERTLKYMENELKYKISELVYKFYPFNPISDIINEIDVVITGEISINANVSLKYYEKYYNDVWSKEIIIKELRRRKLKRIV